MNSFKNEKFKIFEYLDYAEIIPVDEEYEDCMFFFAGFNEIASKYIYLFKNFLEGMQYPAKLKIVIPFLPKYSVEEYAPYWANSIPKNSHAYAWYLARKVDLPSSDFKIEFYPNVEKDDQIIKMVNQEIKKLGSSENIIFSGFSMGGRYLMELLNKIKIKTKFNLIFKGMVIFYKNPCKNEDSTECKLFNQNEFYLYYSLNEKIITFTRCVETISNLKESGFKIGKVKIDNGRKHIVDINCLLYLEKIYNKFKKSNKNPKF